MRNGNPKQPAEQCSEIRDIPAEVQVEIAKHNHELAEFRYRTLVRRGRAWDAPSKEDEHAG